MRSVPRVIHESRRYSPATCIAHVFTSTDVACIAHPCGVVHGKKVRSKHNIPPPFFFTVHSGTEKRAFSSPFLFLSPFSFDPKTSRVSLVARKMAENASAPDIEPVPIPPLDHPTDEQKAGIRNVRAAVTASNVEVQICYAALLRFDGDTANAINFLLHGQDADGAAGCGGEGAAPAVDFAAAVMMDLASAQYSVSGAPYNDRENYTIAFARFLAFNNHLKEVVGEENVEPLFAKMVRALLHQGSSGLSRGALVPPEVTSSDAQAFEYRRNPARNRQLRYMAYLSIVKVLQKATREWKGGRFPLGAFELIIKLRYPERERGHYIGFRAGGDDGDGESDDGDNSGDCSDDDDDGDIF